MIKNIRNVAKNIAHKFSVSANHFAYIALATKSNEVEIDLLTGDISPKHYLIERNKILVSQCIRNFDRLITQQEKQEIRSAKLYVSFVQSNFNTLGDYTIRVILTNGKTVAGTVNVETIPQA